MDPTSSPPTLSPASAHDRPTCTNERAYPFRPSPPETACCTGKALKDTSTATISSDVPFLTSGSNRLLLFLISGPNRLLLFCTVARTGTTDFKPPSFRVTRGGGGGAIRHGKPTRVTSLYAGHRRGSETPSQPSTRHSQAALTLNSAYDSQHHRRRCPDIVVGGQAPAHPSPTLEPTVE